MVVWYSYASYSYFYQFARSHTSEWAPPSRGYIDEGSPLKSISPLNPKTNLFAFSLERSGRLIFRSLEFWLHGQEKNESIRNASQKPHRVLTTRHWASSFASPLYESTPHWCGTFICMENLNGFRQSTCFLETMKWEGSRLVAAPVVWLIPSRRLAWANEDSRFATSLEMQPVRVSSRGNMVSYHWMSGWIPSRKYGTPAVELDYTKTTVAGRRSQ